MINVFKIPYTFFSQNLLKVCILWHEQICTTQSFESSSAFLLTVSYVIVIETNFDKRLMLKRSLSKKKSSFKINAFPNFFD